MNTARRPVVAVVGSGIAGLAAAWELVTAGDGVLASTQTGVRNPAAEPAAPIVHVVEAADRIGGKLASTTFAGRAVDLGADAFLARRPEALELCEQLGLTDELVPVGASGAMILARGRLRAMPVGLNLGVPVRWWPLARSGILSIAESMAVTKDLFLPYRGSGPGDDDRSVAEVVGERMGWPVVERLVDPLIGGIHAGGVETLSAEMTFPALLAASRHGGSLMRNLGGGAADRSPRSSPTGATTSSISPVAGPAFWSFRDGTASLARRLAERLATRGVTIHTGTTVRAMTSEDGGATDGRRWRLTMGCTGSAPPGERCQPLLVDGVVLAVPAPTAGRLLAPLAPVAAAMLTAVDYASVAVVTMSIPTRALGKPLSGTGFLVPRTTNINGQAPLITGCTYLSRKWPHLARPGDHLIRVSTGRFGDTRPSQLDDDELAGSVFGELERVLDIHGAPGDSMVTRWENAFPQYPVGHLTDVAAIHASVSNLPGVAVAGAAYHGVGIPACVGSGRTAARQILDSLARHGGSPPAGSGNGEPSPTGDYQT